MTRRRMVIALIATIGVPFLEAQTTSVPLPATLTVAAQEAPLAFVMSLANASVPSGLEIRSSEPLPPKPDFRTEGEAGMTLTALASLFNSYHRDYRAEAMDGVLFVRPSSKRTSYLDSASTLQVVTVTGTMNAVRKVFANLDPRLDGGGGTIGGGINYDPVEEGEFTKVTLEGRGHRVIDVLNQLAKQSRKAWLVVTSTDGGPTRVIECGLIHRQGTVTKIPVQK